MFQDGKAQAMFTLIELQHSTKSVVLHIGSFKLERIQGDVSNSSETEKIQ
jgi:hypothetical protein